MPQKTDLNVSPYYDDFDESKNFQNILFRPGFAVQARELSQIQSLVQNKMQKVGDHLFRDGAMVVPGQLSMIRGIYSVRIQTTFNSEEISLAQYVNATAPVILTGVTSGVTAKVFAYADATSTQPAKLYVQFVGAKDTSLDSSSAADIERTAVLFTEGEQLKANISITHTSNYAANIASLDVETSDQIKLKTATSKACHRTLTAKIEEGVYYIRGTFVAVAETIQVLELIEGSNSTTLTNNKGDTYYTGRVGLKITEEIITPE